MNTLSRRRVRRKKKYWNFIFEAFFSFFFFSFLLHFHVVLLHCVVTCRKRCDTGDGNKYNITIMHFPFYFIFKFILSLFFFTFLFHFFSLQYLSPQKWWFQQGNLQLIPFHYLKSFGDENKLGRGWNENKKNEMGEKLKFKKIKRRMI